jgi:cardiolipin synthase
LKICGYDGIVSKSPSFKINKFLQVASLNVPNFLTLCRVLLIPLLLIFLINGRFGIALLIFVAAAITDALDGMVAKLFHQKTTFGAYFDPVADKLLIDSAFVALSILSVLPSWLAIIVLSRDVLILLGIAIFLLTDRPLTIKPILSSKVTTFLQMVTVCLFFEHPIFAKIQVLRNYLVVLTSFFTLFSGFYYIYIGFSLLNNGGENKDKGVVQGGSDTTTIDSRGR